MATFGKKLSEAFPLWDLLISHGQNVTIIWQLDGLQTKRVPVQDPYFMKYNISKNIYEVSIFNLQLKVKIYHTHFSFKYFYCILAL